MRVLKYTLLGGLAFVLPHHMVLLYIFPSPRVTVKESGEHLQMSRVVFFLLGANNNVIISTLKFLFEV